MGVDCVVLTYEALHRKTYDTLCLLKVSGYNNVLVWATPMSYKKTFSPIYEHRPPINNDISTKQICEAFHYEYMSGIGGYENLDVGKEIPILVCGAGLLPEVFIKNHIVINSHPGFIPLARGLDAFKWSIIEDLPIGVTTHLIGDEVDAGEIIERREISVYTNDTFHALAQRVYENEICMLVSSISKMHEKHTYISSGNTVQHKRMPADIECSLLQAFNDYIKRHGIRR